MAAPSPWPTIHAERKALIADLQDLPTPDWKTPSLCEGWSVREVLGHMAATAKKTPMNFLPGLAGSGFNFVKMVNKDVARETAGEVTDTLRRFSAEADSTKAPPGPVDSWLGEALVHAEDIRRPLGIAHAYPTEAVTRTLDFYKGSNMLIGAKKRVAGLSMRATDADWSTGSGPEVVGPAMSLLMAMTGRRAALDDLSGAGLETLRSRT